jgi:hypothetical protein
MAMATVKKSILQLPNEEKGFETLKETMLIYMKTLLITTLFITFINAALLIMEFTYN